MNGFSVGFRKKMWPSSFLFELWVDYLDAPQVERSRPFKSFSLDVPSLLLYPHLHRSTSSATNSHNIPEQFTAPHLAFFPPLDIPRCTSVHQRPPPSQQQWTTPSRSTILIPSPRHRNIKARLGNNNTATTTTFLASMTMRALLRSRECGSRGCSLQ